MKPSPDLADCASEPIRVPGAIQPHGRLVVLDADLRVVAYSANWPGAAAAAAAVAGLPFGVLVAGDAAMVLGSVPLDGAAHSISAHRLGPCVIAEFEAATPAAGLELPIHSLARHFLPQLQATNAIADLGELAVAEMKRLTGFGRCLFYRFDDEDHGEVMAEALDDGYDAYSGHHFPASDIPAQARALYVVNQVRLIPDANYTPVPLLGVDPAWDPSQLDMTRCGLRSISPIHLEYMRNMGTLASMSVSIVVRGRLWGLISCHDHAPRHVDAATRIACEHLGRLLSMRIEAREETAEVEARLELRRLTLDIVSHLGDSDATLQRLLAETAPLLRLGRATGAAVVRNDACWTVGDAPSEEVVQALAQWACAQPSQVVSTDRLAERLPALAEATPVAAGVMAVSISQVNRHVILWFRPEILQSIRWAGDPRKEALASDGRIHPRLSFSSWQQEIRGRSLPWSRSELAAAADLRQALIGIVLRRAEEMAEVASELGKLNKELEAFSYTVSHDLRAPMRHISGYVDLVLEGDGAGLGERSQRYLRHVKEASAFAGQLVDALLEFSRMGRATLKRRPVDTNLLVNDLARELTHHHRDRVIRWDIAPDLPVMHGDPVLLQVAVRNLLDNAVKYTREREVAEVSVAGVHRPEGAGIAVSDNGIGFEMDYVDKLFGVFQRLHQSDEFEGTGIGLASVKRIVERHGGIVWAEGELNRGARFGFVLPLPEEVR
jgi:light-regulated signal transduction histidine kinase (bacteriophytochrome)